MENTSRKNNFNFWRFTAASFVIISHSFSLLRHNQINFLGSLGVIIFFIISGYLITQSWVYGPDPLKFLQKRLLRILPALVFCTLFTLLIIGPLTTSLKIDHYFSNPKTWSYLKNVLLYPLQFTLPGVFDKNISAHNVNHSLWTLPIEFTLYLFVLLFGFSRVLKRNIIVIGVILLIITNFYISGFSFYKSQLYGIGYNEIISLFIYFFIGSAIFLLQKKIKFNSFLFVVALFIFIAGFHIPYGQYSYYIVLPYIIFSITFFHKRIPFFHKTDPSYGMYLFSMPIQQTIIHFNHGIKPFTLLISSYICTLAVAYVSWHFVESKFLLLKSKL